MSSPFFQPPKPIHDHFTNDAEIVLFNGDVQELLGEIPDQTIQLVITSPPYNLGKDYEHRVDIEKYLEQQTEIIAQLFRVLKDFSVEENCIWQT